MFETFTVEDAFNNLDEEQKKAFYLIVDCIIKIVKYSKKFENITTEERTCLYALIDEILEENQNANEENKSNGIS